MCDLPTREEAQRYLERYYGNRDAANWHYAKNAAFKLIRGRADGILQTRQEFTDSVDSRLQAIKDAPRCKHGRIDEHRFRLICYHVTYKACRESVRCWCNGAPRLRSLLGALTEKCICVKLKDTGGFQIADLTCPIHGIDGTNPGDWQENNDE